jgi:protein-tyrosine phosphatase
MRPALYTIRRTGPGTLSTMARPRGGDWPDDEMTALASAGVSVLVSPITDAEMTELRLSAEPQAAQAAGLTFYGLPTPDRHTPDQAASLALANTLRSHLNAGESIVIHCRHGIGRSSTVTEIILVLDGVVPEQAWSQISAARGLTVPDTTAQRD